MSVLTQHALDSYEHYRVQRISLKTWDTEKRVLQNFADWCSAKELRVDQVTALDLDDWWWAQAWTDATRHSRAPYLRNFFAYAIVRRWVKPENDPSLLLTARKPMRAPTSQLSVVELLAMLDRAQYPQHRVVLALAMNLALRASEIRRLRMKDLLGPKIRVTVEKTREIVDMPVSSDLAAELDRWMPEYRRGATLGQLSRESYLVPSQWTSTVTERVAYRPARPIGDPEDVVARALATIGREDLDNRAEGKIHLIRRSTARHFYDAAVLEDGENDALLATMRLLHHRKPTTTLDYIGVNKQDEALDRVLLGRPFLTRLAGGVSPLRIAQ